MKDLRAIVITGASSGIGAALARAYAAPGIHLALSGRNAARLGAVATACREAGAAVEETIVDVSDAPAMAGWLAECDSRNPVDLLIANAGISAGTGGGSEPASQARAIFAVNLDGVLNTVLPLLSAMQQRRRGQIAIMSSLASFRGFPGAPAYCASKAAVRFWGEALRGELWESGVRVSVICPGYIVSAMTAENKFPMPMLMTAERAAAIMKRGLAADRARIAFPWPLYLAVWLIGTLPPALTDPLMRLLPKKH
jgi:short-subunit dehydrogenase